MKTLMKAQLIGMMMASLFLSTACSNVSFAPEAAQAPEQIQKTPDSPASPVVTPPPVVVVPPPELDKTVSEDFLYNEDSQAKVDILFIVDNSFSMIDNQRKLGDRLENFVTSLGQIDWQIGVTTTDMSSGPYGLKGSLAPFKNLGTNVLTKDAPNFLAEFKNTIVREESVSCGGSTCPSSDERPIEALANAIAKKDSANAGFFRAAADLAVIVLSDEDERSKGGAGAMSPVVALQTFAAAFGDKKSLTGYGLLVQPGDSSCKSKQGLDAAYGTFVSLLAQLTGGVIGSICNTDYSQTLQSIGKKIREVSVAFELKQSPNESTVQLTITPFDASLKWNVTGKTVKFNKAPKKGTKIKISYLPK